MAGLRLHLVFRITNRFTFQVDVTEYFEPVLFFHRCTSGNDEDDENDDRSEKIEETSLS